MRREWRLLSKPTLVEEGAGKNQSTVPGRKEPEPSSRLCFGLPGSRCCPVLALFGLISASSSLSGSRRCLRTHNDSPLASVDPGSSPFGHACVFGPFFGPESNSCKCSSSQLGCRPRLQRAPELPFSGSHLLSPGGWLPPGSVPRLSFAQSYGRFRLCPEQLLIPYDRAQLPPGFPLGSSCRLQRVLDAANLVSCRRLSSASALISLCSASIGLGGPPSPDLVSVFSSPCNWAPAATPKLLSEAPRLRLLREEDHGLPAPPPYRLLPLSSAPNLSAILCQLLLSASGSPDASAANPESVASKADEARQRALPATPSAFLLR